MDIIALFFFPGIHDGSASGEFLTGEQEKGSKILIDTPETRTLGHSRETTRLATGLQV